MGSRSMEVLGSSILLNSAPRTEIFFNCFICGCTFDDEVCFKDHILTHSSNFKHKVVPFDSIAYSHTLGAFEAGDSDNKKYFITNAYVKSNSDVSSSCNDKKYACTVCSKQFKKKDHLNKHLVLHSGIKPFVCLICGKSYARKDRFKEHYNVIHSLSGWTCYTCGQMFPQRCILRKHELIHRGIKPFGCDLCRKKYSRKNDLMRHWTSHTGEKPHSCNVCDKRFSQKRLLNRHSLLHLKNPLSSI